MKSEPEEDPPLSFSLEGTFKRNPHERLHLVENNTLLHAMPGGQLFLTPFGILDSVFDLG